MIPLNALFFAKYIYKDIAMKLTQYCWKATSIYLLSWGMSLAVIALLLSL